MSEAPVSLPRINEPAPEFEAVTTHGTLKLSSLRGKWVVLFSHPADFTPVCTTEFIGFANRYNDFSARNATVVGLSIDSIYSHIAWVRNIEEKLGVKVPFPVIADLDMKVAKSYGMVHPGASETSTVRSVFIIDDKGTIRALVYYPMNAGRSIDEIVRLLDALQTADKHAVACPEGWRPGEAVIVPAPKTQADAEKRVTMADLDIKDWYLSKKKLS
jgi:peroxiredoxin (alkyl hydroperoxide reductase subunit C)